MSAGTVAITPFENLSGDAARDYFARGFVRAVATELSGSARGIAPSPTGREVHASQWRLR